MQEKPHLKPQGICHRGEHCKVYGTFATNFTQDDATPCKMSTQDEKNPAALCYEILFAPMS
jgi:hypothetical protein